MRRSELNDCKSSLTSTFTVADGGLTSPLRLPQLSTCYKLRRTIFNVDLFPFSPPLPSLTRSLLPSLLRVSLSSLSFCLPFISLSHSLFTPSIFLRSAAIPLSTVSPLRSCSPSHTDVLNLSTTKFPLQLGSSPCFRFHHDYPIFFFLTFPLSFLPYYSLSASLTSPPVDQSLPPILPLCRDLPSVSVTLTLPHSSLPFFSLLLAFLSSCSFLLLSNPSLFLSSQFPALSSSATLSPIYYLIPPSPAPLSSSLTFLIPLSLLFLLAFPPPFTLAVLSPFHSPSSLFRSLSPLTVSLLLLLLPLSPLLSLLLFPALTFCNSFSPSLSASFSLFLLPSSVSERTGDFVSCLLAGRLGRRPDFGAFFVHLSPFSPFLALSPFSLSSSPLPFFPALRRPSHSSPPPHPSLPSPPSHPYPSLHPCTLHLPPLFLTLPPSHPLLPTPSPLPPILPHPSSPPFPPPSPLPSLPPPSPSPSPPLPLFPLPPSLLPPPLPLSPSPFSLPFILSPFLPPSLLPASPFTTPSPSSGGSDSFAPAAAPSGPRCIMRLRSQDGRWEA
ncbi:hypothetical protein C7M84_015289 [Penaeus vannamei]|uniref:Uncharacterized protein n=1 Tax=Penaeus vannamei TaxID=6689 RepID=A0A3R7Q2C2_PENVA|nr:hypothetical protein C7M84_015289 [Penaeus vannamei]